MPAYSDTVISLGVNQTASTIGGLAVGVPGEMRGEFDEGAIPLLALS